jgi:hypothetical protein
MTGSVAATGVVTIETNYANGEMNHCLHALAGRERLGFEWAEITDTPVLGVETR